MADTTPAAPAPMSRDTAHAVRTLNQDMQREQRFYDAAHTLRAANEALNRLQREDFIEIALAAGLTIWQAHHAYAHLPAVSTGNLASTYETYAREAGIARVALLKEAWNALPQEERDAIDAANLERP